MLHTEKQGQKYVQRSPSWWRAEHQSGWDRVKAAMKRDWEQTKADFTKGKKGQDLNQEVDDTVGQMFGKRPIPPETVPNPLDAKDIEKKVKKAQDDMEKQAERLAKDTEKAVARDARETGWTRWAQWEEAETPLRYGYGAGAYYTDAWDDALEGRLRREWDDLYPDQGWDDVRDTVRQGWDQARPH